MSQNQKPMTSLSPYLLRALHQWIIDNDQTPHLLINTKMDGVVVPKSILRPDGTLVLNASYAATEQMSIGDEYMSFKTRFHGKSEEIFVPIQAIISVFSKESGTGMALQPYAAQQDDQSTMPVMKAPPPVAEQSSLAVAGKSDRPPPGEPSGEGRKVGHLRVIK